MSEIICSTCGTERVEVEYTVLKKLVQLIEPNMTTVKKTTRADWLSVCPRCDAYGLGVDLNETFPLHTYDGAITDIRTLVNAAGFWES